MEEEKRGTQCQQQRGTQMVGVGAGFREAWWKILPSLAPMKYIPQVQLGLVLHNIVGV